METWKTIDGYDNYFISSHGNVENGYTGKLIRPWISSKGYYYVGLCKNGKKRSVSVHKLVANAFVDNPDNKLCVDHIDNNRLNNNESNLRFATYTENGINKKKQSNNTSGIVGVCFDKSRNKWMAHYTLNGKFKGLGRYDTLEEAKLARQRAVNIVFGDFCHISEKI